jgi:sugar phosphate isomerase/epimerase
VTPDHLARWLEIARALDVVTVRPMPSTATHRPTREEARTLLEKAVPAYEASGVRIALETYEKVPTTLLADVVAAIGSPSPGICSDPANCVAAPELPQDVIELVAPHVVNMHVKDFRFTRQAGSTRRRTARLRRDGRADRSRPRHREPDRRAPAAVAG